MALSTSNAERRLDALPSWVFKAMLFATAVFWGSGFFVMKDAVEVLGPSTLVGTRYSLAALVMLVLFHRNIRAHLTRDVVGAGLLLGVVYFLAFLVQTIGLADTTPGKNAFLTAVYVVLVPFVFWVVARRRPTLSNIVMAVICLAGIGLVSLDESLSIGYGDAMTLLCTLFYATHVALLGRFAPGKDVFTLAFLQHMVCGVLGLSLGLLTEPQPAFSQIANPAFLGQIAWLALVCSFGATLFQTIGQSRVAPAQATIIMSLESVFGVLFSVLFYGEVLTVRIFVGFALVFVAIVGSELLSQEDRPGLAEPQVD